MRSSTKYQVNSHSNICVNKDCQRGLPHYAGYGKSARRRCGSCGQPMRRIEGEPRSNRR